MGCNACMQYGNICQAVRGQAERERQGRMATNVCLCFACIKPVLFIPCELWVLGRNVPKIQRHCVASIHMCGLYCDNFTQSCKLYSCDTVNSIRTTDIRYNSSQSI